MLLCFMFYVLCDNVFVFNVLLSHLNKRLLKVKVKSNYFIVRPKVDQRAGKLSLPHLGFFLF